MHPNAPAAVTTEPAYTATAVLYDGTNHLEVGRLIARILGPEHDDGATGWMQVMHSHLLQLWDPRVGNWRWAKPGDWIIVDSHGILAIDTAWYQVLFTQEPTARAERLGVIRALLDQAQQAFADFAGPAPAVSVAEPDPWSAANLRQAIHRVQEESVPVGGDVWSDRYLERWTVVWEGTPGIQSAVLESGNRSMEWDSLWNARGPLHLTSRLGMPHAA